MQLADVAKKAGVSVTTVSRVINYDPNVKASTRLRVERVLKELNYYPNLHAQSLAGRGSKTLGFLASNLDNPFFIDIYRRFEQLAEEKGYDSVVAATHFDPDRLRVGIRSMAGRRVAGIAAMVSEIEPQVVEELSKIGIPVVFLDVGCAGEHVTNIRFNYRKGMRQLVEYLYSLGHRRMAFISYPLPLWATEERRTTFLETMGQYGAAAHVLPASSDNFVSGREAAGALVASGFAPTAILCVNDLTAVGVLKELSERGISVPRQISVTGFDNIALSQVTIPSLTTIHIPGEQIARLAFQALVSSSNGPSIMGQEITVDPELIVRQSTGPAPANADRPNDV
jgi:DNA-binding LacI/PurR family transcriptional regulator